jgi:hypothetical protein
VQALDHRQPRDRSAMVASRAVDHRHPADPTLASAGKAAPRRMDIINAARVRTSSLWNAAGVASPSTKQILKHLIDDLPADAPIADVQYRLYIIDAVSRGRDEIASGTGIPHEQVADEMRGRWGRAREK